MWDSTDRIISLFLLSASSSSLYFSFSFSFFWGWRCGVEEKDDEEDVRMVFAASKACVHAFRWVCGVWWVLRMMVAVQVLVLVLVRGVEVETEMERI